MNATVIDSCPVCACEHEGILRLAAPRSASSPQPLGCSTGCVCHGARARNAWQRKGPGLVTPIPAQRYT